MGAMLRSDDMTLCDIYIQPEAAFEILTNLGDMGCVQFLDNNTEQQPNQKKYITDLCRCADMERKLRYMENEMVKDKIVIANYKDEPKPMQPNEMFMYENLLQNWKIDIAAMADLQIGLKKNYQELVELQYMWKNIGPILGDAEWEMDTMFRKENAGGDVTLAGKLFVTTGVVKRVRSFAFEMMIWRISRGNIYYRQTAQDAILQDPTTGQEIRKVAFIAVCQGEALHSCLEKVCNGFRASIYHCPQTHEERMEMIDKVEIRISDLMEVLNKARYHRCKAMRTIALQLRGWEVQLKKAKAIYYNLNLFNLDITTKCLIGQCWVPSSDVAKVQTMLEVVSNKIGTNNMISFMSKVETDEKPPTYHRTNKFTNGFQALINAYGESTYRELNPGLYTLVSFPFLFSLMFSDVGHGLILLLTAVWMVTNEKKFIAERSTNEIWNILFGGRYVILMLGLFSMFSGFVFNDYFSIGAAFVTPYWRNTFSTSVLEEKAHLDMDPKKETGLVYPFGIDPVIKICMNKIVIENSVKMKLSIIIGIIHMTFGLFMSLYNNIYFRQGYLIILQFIPQLLFLMCLFAWLVFLMYYKWFMYSAKSFNMKETPGCAPAILILFIDMALLSETKPVSPGCDAYMFDNQRTIQLVLVIIAVSCVPIILLGSPIYVYCRSKRKKKVIKVEIDRLLAFRRRLEDEKKLEQLYVKMEKYTVHFSELMIHQGVHTIEYVLSTISHTASYLRLWALSLAHAQLSEMLWAMILSKLGLRDHSTIGPIKLVIIFAIWAGFTISILVMMEGLSAFLHTLRLHWVEFMSKFFDGDGWIFCPFSFRDIFVADDKGMEGACKMHD